MRKTVIALVLGMLMLASVSPLTADWRADASSLTWFIQRPTAEAGEYQAALLWYYSGQPFNGLLATAARPHVALTDLGGGTSELAITLPLNQGNAWVAALVAGPCPAANTAALRRACADPLIKTDARRILREYRFYQREQSTPVAEPPAL